MVAAKWQYGQWWWQWFLSRNAGDYYGSSSATLTTAAHHMVHVGIRCTTSRTSATTVVVIVVHEYMATSDGIGGVQQRHGYCHSGQEIVLHDELVAQSARSAIQSTTRCKWWQWCYSVLVRDSRTRSCNSAMAHGIELVITTTAAVAIHGINGGSQKVVQHDDLVSQQDCTTSQSTPKWQWWCWQ
jgi:hypothetical protein